MKEAESTSSVWTDKSELPKFPTLTEAKECDVCIVGGGITGFTAAFLLAAEGKSVIIIDDGPLSHGETERTTAHLTDVLDMRYHELIEKHGIENARIIFQSYRAALDQIATIVRQEKIDCDFEKVDGHLFLDPMGKLDEL